MMGGNIRDFLGNLGYVDVAVEYAGSKYVLYGINYDSTTQLYSFLVEQYTLDNKYPYGTFIRTVFHDSSGSRSVCLNHFFDAALIDGKTFRELEKDMTWIET